MFGIDQISWGVFGSFILLALVFWYLSVILNAVSKARQRNRHSLFEEEQAPSLLSQELNPVAVRASDLPSEILPFPWESDVPLPTSFYEETGLDEGYDINCFTRQGDPSLPTILEQVQFQQ
ncbi:hypothetical protein [Mangrovibacterium lignilyticum]|uniref:hypothetical protein n=1 Tax=Mangrovibacterium lignilyticum TaxID=2668052 RepID=UPI0013D0D697|nr:hypothetical protein [Mangrovibacterium lignilyticum]